MRLGSGVRQIAGAALLVSALLGLPFSLQAQELGARYLIIAGDELLQAARVLEGWKTSKGMLARTVPASVAGGANNPRAIQAYIREAWRNWPIPPEYVLILGSPEHVRAHQDMYDTRFGDMTGGYEMEIPVGRLPAEDPWEAHVMVNKTIAYENPTPGRDTSWYLKGTTTLCEDGSSDDTIYWNDARTCHRYWTAENYIHIDSFSRNTSGGSREVDAAAHDGRAFITYRGQGAGRWRPPFGDIQPRNWDNGARMPVVVGATCATVTLAPYESMYGDKFVRAGTPERLGGAVAYFGTTRSGGGIARQRSNCFRGFFQSLFEAGDPSLGVATLKGRRAVQSGEIRYEEWNLLGDPGLNVWTGVPRVLSVEHDTLVDLEPHPFEVVVRHDGLPVQGAIVCVSMDSGVHVVDTTDVEGRAVPEVGPGRPGDLRVVVTGRNLMPYVGSCRARASGRPFVVYSDHGIADRPPGGNGDSCVVGGETAAVLVRVVNYGDSTARGVTGRLSVSDSMVVLLDSVEEFGELPPGGESAGIDGFGFRVHEHCPDGHVLLFNLICEDDIGRTWQSEIRFMTGVPELTFCGFAVLDSAGNNNGRLDPGEEADLVVTLGNTGYGTAHGVWAKLRRSDRRFYILDSVGEYGRIPGLTNQSNLEDRFRVWVWWVPPGTRHTCTLRLHSAVFDTVIPFEITIGDRDTIDPVPDGPRDPPLYWAYDNIDIGHRECPDYDWVELRGIGERLNLWRNESRVLSLPDSFGPFRYYDVEYDRLMVNANGWIVPGSTAVAPAPFPRPLPDSGLPAFLAPYWHYFDPPNGGGILWHHDVANRRVILEWDSVYQRHGSYFASFQVVLHDTTRVGWDGNNEFLYQYKAPNGGSSVTVGLQDPYSFVGITVLHAGNYEKSAASIVPGRAIKFTTDGPYTGVEEPADRSRVPEPRVSLRASPVPFADRVLVSLTTRSAGWSRVGVYDLTGREVRLLVDRQLSAGRHAVGWDGRDMNGRRLPGGVYFIRLESSNNTIATEKVLKAE